MLTVCPICGKEYENTRKASKNKNCFECTYEIMNEKRRKTSIERFGYENAAQAPEIKKKYIQTQTERYGGMGGFSMEQHKKHIQEAAHSDMAEAKRHKTCLVRWGGIHHMKNKDLVARMQEDKISKYGTNGPHKRYLFENIYFDSSWELAYYVWLKDNGAQFEYHPSIILNYIDGTGEHRYFPDFLVNGQLVEIKGNQFFNEKGEPFNNFTQEFWWEKYEMLKRHNVMIIRDASAYLSYLEQKYGKTILRECTI